MLVNYSDSESDGESASAPPPKAAAKAAKAGFQASSGKIKVDLPALRPDPGAAPSASDEPPAKRARIGGGGINSFLPAPKKTAQNAPKKGVSLKTSSEAAFSREVPETPRYDEAATNSYGGGEYKAEEKKVEEPVKLVGKATRFLPLSVSSKKKKKKPALPTVPAVTKSHDMKSGEAMDGLTAPEPVQEVKPKPKRSLFSVQQEEPEEPAVPLTETYEPLTIPQEEPPQEAFPEEPPIQQQTNPNSLTSVASDLNLTAAQKRHLFGRNGNKDVNITHFNMDSEYAHNEKLRQDGEVTEHRAVKAIAPGKHSLQQLVNNAKTQKDGLEDAWAEGKKNRGEGSARYGWAK